jgi:hypothetical protein
MIRTLLLLLAFTATAFAQTPDGLIANPGFENDLSGWKPLWTREPGAGTLTLDTQQKHGGQSSGRIDFHGEKDWSLDQAGQIDVKPGDLFELTGWVKLNAKDQGGVTLAVSTWDSQGQVKSWNYGARSLRESSDWTQLKSNFVVPAGIARIQVRLLGYGPATSWADDLSLVKKGNLTDMRRNGLPSTLNIENPALAVAFSTTDATFTVQDKRTGKTYQQAPLPDIVVLDASVTGSRIEATLISLSQSLTFKATLNLEADRPEFTVDLASPDEVQASIRYPSPFLSAPGDFLVVPMNEGITYPVDDPSIKPMRLVAYSGHGICMAFWGVTDGQSGQMAIIETPDDAAIQIDRSDGRLTIAPQWDSQKGRLGYTRRLRYIFLDHGGYVAMAKRYRTYAQQIGLFKTLAQKKAENPNVDLLIGAVNVWCWDKDAVSLVTDMQTAGIDRILWSNEQSPENLKALDDLGVLTSRYDLYQDVMDPATFPLLNGVHPCWPTAAWPKDIVLDAHGAWVRGWGVKGKDGKMYPCGVLSDIELMKYARPRITEELATHPYRCRFIDTSTASPWREDYSPDHPMTRTVSRQARMAMLDYVSGESKLVTGSETGIDASVPYLDYFEGMLSLAPYRVNDSGRKMQEIWDQVPENVAKFQVGYGYRIPLWELVYHDCVVAQWYWGDYSNKLPATWDKRDLFNVLYGTPPMFMFDRALWEKDKQRFVQSYKNTAPTVRAVGYSEMTDHRFLTPDRSVQQSAFANGTTVTVNFGSQPYRLPDGSLLAAGGYRVDNGAR